MRTLFSSLSGPDARLIFTVTLSPSVESMTPSVKPPSLSGTQHDLFGSYGCNENIHGIERTMKYYYYLPFLLQPIYLLLYLSLYISLYTSLYLSLYLSFYLSLYLSLSISLSITLSIYCSIYLPIHISLSLPVYLSIYQSILYCCRPRSWYLIT